MSGIAGILKSSAENVSREELSCLADAIAHRGPDGRGYFADSCVGLAHNYLSIPSAVSAPQPLYNEDKSLVIVCDGRVYNHAELRHRLEQQGHTFQTACDAEVLLHLYEEEGEQRFLDDVNGMYGLSLWDSRQRRLILARDRIGIKPLYYTHAPSGLLFGSEIKAVLADSTVRRRVNPRAMSDFFGLSYVFDSQTMFVDIMAVPPGCIYTVEPGAATGRMHTYWEFDFVPDHPWNEAELVEKGRAILEAAVRLELADVNPMGIHLSGGIDSSYITSLATEMDRDRIIALSAGFREKIYDERDYARMAAEKAGVEHREIEVFPEESTFLDVMKKVIWHVDEPTVSPGIHSFYILNQFTAEHVKVVLGGQGSNELLAGYNRYIMADLRDRFARHLKHLSVPGMLGDFRTTKDFYGLGPLKGMVATAFRSSGERALKIASTFPPREKAGLFSGRILNELGGYTTERRYVDGFNGAPASTTIDRMMYLDMKNMMPNMCRILDRTCAAFGVEPRTPFLDHHFVEFAASLSDDAVLRGTESKYILKKMGEGILKHETIYRDKSGFAAPVTPWLQGHLRTMGREILFSEKALDRGFFNADRMRQIVDRHEKSGKGVWQVWMLLIFELWNQRFIDQQG